MNRAFQALFLLLGIALPFSAPASAEIKIAVFDSAKVLVDSKVGAAAQVQLNKFKNDRQGDISSREKEVVDLQNKYVTQSLTLSPEKKEEMEKQIDLKKTDFKRFVQDSERELAERLDKVQRDLQQKLTEVIEAYGKEQGYAIIFERLQCVFNSDSVDVTPEITQRFDQTYGNTSGVAPSGGKR